MPYQKHDLQNFFPFCVFGWCPLKHKSFKFWWSPVYLLFILLLVLLVFNLKILCQIQGCKDLLLSPLLRVLWFLQLLIAVSLVHFELIIFCGVRSGSTLFCTWLSSDPSTICWKDYSFPIDWFWCLVENHLRLNCVDLFLDCELPPLVCVSVLTLISHCLDPHCFVVRL